MSLKDIIGNIPIANPPTSELPVRDSLDRARRVWRKGRFEFMGGPTMYTQGNNIEGYDNQERICGYPPSGSNLDPISHDLGMDITEQ